jgi:hypothetical protein
MSLKWASEHPRGAFLSVTSPTVFGLLNQPARQKIWHVIRMAPASDVPGTDFCIRFAYD